jgi:hypothetical protein
LLDPQGTARTSQLDFRQRVSFPAPDKVQTLQFLNTQASSKPLVVLSYNISSINIAYSLNLLMTPSLGFKPKQMRLGQFCWPAEPHLLRVTQKASANMPARHLLLLFRPSWHVLPRFVIFLTLSSYMKQIQYVTRFGGSTPDCATLQLLSNGGLAGNQLVPKP